MNGAVPAMFVALTGSLILVFTYLGLYFQERRKYFALWLASWAFYAVRFIFEILAALWGNREMLLALNQLSVLWSGIFLLWGTYLFFGKKAEWRLAGARCRRKSLDRCRNVLPLFFLLGAGTDILCLGIRKHLDRSRSFAT